MRYAEHTTVGVDKIRGELTGLLTSHGIMRQAWGFDDTLQFELHQRRYQITIARPTTEEILELYPNTRDAESKKEQEWRRRWRARLLWLKATLEFSEEVGATTALAGFALLPDGRTVGAALEDPQYLLASGR